MNGRHPKLKVEDDLIYLVIWRKPQYSCEWKTISKIKIEMWPKTNENETKRQILVERNIKKRFYWNRPHYPTIQRSDIMNIKSENIFLTIGNIHATQLVLWNPLLIRLLIPQVKFVDILLDLSLSSLLCFQTWELWFPPPLFSPWSFGKPNPTFWPKCYPHYSIFK
jgi:hypothetical protein